MPVLNREQVRQVDQAAIGQYGMSGLVLMENAGRGCADVLCRLGISAPVVICCGKGNNAGDGFVLARHLDLRGAAVKVVLWGEPKQLSSAAATNFAILSKCDVPIVQIPTGHDPDRLSETLDGADWAVDALLGTGARGKPRPPFDAVIEQLNQHSAGKLALDLPSGLDCDSGQPAQPTFRADHTCTFIAAKPGLLVDAAKPFVGQLHILDIGAPRKLIEAAMSGGASG